MCDGEQALMYKSAKDYPKDDQGKDKRDDRTNAEALEYSLWVNVIEDSRKCIKTFGLLPTPMIEQMKTCLPNLFSIYNHHVKNDDTTSLAFKEILQHCLLQSLSAYNSRVLGTPKTWKLGKKAPLIGIMKIFIGLATYDYFNIKRGERSGKKRPQLFRKGYIDKCVSPDFKFDSIVMSNKFGVQTSGYITSYSDMKLVDCDDVLSGYTLATHCFEPKVEPNAAVAAKSTNAFRKWQKKHAKLPYYELDVDDGEGDEDVFEGGSPNKKKRKKGPKKTWNRQEYGKSLEPIEEMLNRLDHAVRELGDIDAITDRMSKVKDEFQRITQGMEMNEIDWTKNKGTYKFRKSVGASSNKSDDNDDDSIDSNAGSGMESDESNDSDV